MDTLKKPQFGNKQPTQTSQEPVAKQQESAPEYYPPEITETVPEPDAKEHVDVPIQHEPYVEPVERQVTTWGIKTMLHQFLGKKKPAVEPTHEDISKVREIISSKVRIEPKEIVLTRLDPAQRSCNVLLAFGMHAVCPEDHAIVRYNNTNVLVNNSFIDYKQIEKVLDMLLAEKSGEISVYSVDPVERILNDLELKALLAGSEGAITEIRNYDSHGELLYHGIRTL